MTLATKTTPTSHTEASMAMNDRDDRIRASDADRERVIARLRDHFAEGRLTRDELDERVTAALNAKTFGDLRVLMTDLPEPAPASTAASTAARTLPRAAAGPVFVRRGPRLLPLAMLFLLVATLGSGGGFVFLALFPVVLVFSLLAGVVALFAAARFRRRMRHYWQLTQGRQQPWSYPL
jgi:hypothetical protein